MGLNTDCFNAGQGGDKSAWEYFIRLMLDDRVRKLSRGELNHNGARQHGAVSTDEPIQEALLYMHAKGYRLSVACWKDWKACFCQRVKCAAERFGRKGGGKKKNRVPMPLDVGREFACESNSCDDERINSKRLERVRDTLCELKKKWTKDNYTLFEEVYLKGKKSRDVAREQGVPVERVYAACNAAINLLRRRCNA